MGSPLSIMLLDMDRDCLLPTAAFGLPTRSMSRLKFRMGQGVAGWVAENSEAALIDDVEEDPRYVHLPGARSKGGSRTESMICVPLAAHGETIGVMPRMHRTLKMFEPTTLPRTMSPSRLRPATILVFQLG